MNISDIIFDNARATNWVLTEIPNPPSKWLHYLKSKKKRVRNKYQNRIDNMPRKTICGKLEGFDRTYGTIGSLNPYLEIKPKDLYIGVSMTPLDFDTSNITEPNSNTGYKREKIWSKE